jgi:peptidyl-prolyl cis-trans isomerase SurA
MIRLIKKIPYFVVTFSLVSFFFFSTYAQAEIIDRIVAIVNDDVITFSDLNQEGASIFRRIMQQAPPEQIEMTLLKAREEILSGLIDKMIIEQRATKTAITVTQKEIDQAIASLIAANKLTPEKFQQQLQMMGTSEQDYHGVIKHQLLQQKLVEYEIRSRVVITDEKIKEFYNKNYAQKQQKDAYHILQMGFTWAKESPSAKKQAFDTAEEIRQQAISGQDFKTLARQHSILPSATDGGDIGVFKRNEMASYMKKTITNMEPGQISNIIETPSGYQFYKLLSNQGNIELQSSYEKVKDEIRDQLLNETLNNQFQKWVQELRDQAYIKKML